MYPDLSTWGTSLLQQVNPGVGGCAHKAIRNSSRGDNPTVTVNTMSTFESLTFMSIVQIHHVGASRTCREILWLSKMRNKFFKISLRGVSTNLVKKKSPENSPILPELLSKIPGEGNILQIFWYNFLKNKFLSSHVFSNIFYSYEKKLLSLFSFQMLYL